MTLTSQTVQAKTHGDTVYLYVSIGGTDEPEDNRISLNFLPNKKGFHRGCDRVAHDLASQFDKKYEVFRGIKAVRLKGHSLGAAVAELMAYYLERKGWKIESVRLYGGFGVVRKSVKYIRPYQIQRVRAGHDVVPRLMFWNRNKTTDQIPGDPDAKWPLRFIADHNSYPWREY